MSPNTFISGIGSVGESASRRDWIPPTPEELAPHFPQLEILELLGQGGMGAVYKVRQRDLDRFAALKILPANVANDPSFTERFLREARALALLGHQHIVTVYEFGQRDRLYFLLMEYIDGVTLRQAIRARQITDREALTIVVQICEALQFAHEEGVVHRDIKPENILIDKRGRVKIADFGLAKLLGRSLEVPTLTRTNQAIGTPLYMSPEQIEGTRGVDHRSDIFSLGVVFYELLTGELPLGRFAPPSQKYQLDVRLDDVVLRTLEKEPDRRYQQASDVRYDVESIRSQPNIPKSTDSDTQMRSFRFWPRRKKHPLERERVRRKRWSWRKRFAALGLCFLAVSITFIWFSIVADRRRLQDELWNARRQMTDLAGQLNSARSPISNLNKVRRDSGSPGRKAPAKVAAATPSRSGLAEQPLSEAVTKVQFPYGNAQLNPLFGERELLDDQRQIINRILNRFHKAYLEIEDRRLQTDTADDGTRVIVTGDMDSEISKLENDLWSEIDSNLPIEVQRFLRAELPLYGDPEYPVRILIDGTNQRIITLDSVVLLYPQILGWAKGRSTTLQIKRQGKWYRWSIGSSDTHNGYYSKEGESPELPSCFHRFWKEDETPSALNNPTAKSPTKADADSSDFNPSPYSIPKKEPPATPPSVDLDPVIPDQQLPAEVNPTQDELNVEVDENPSESTDRPPEN